LRLGLRGANCSAEYHEQDATDGANLSPAGIRQNEGVKTKQISEVKIVAVLAPMRRRRIEKILC
jgi:hypothetical protein